MLIVMSFMTGKFPPPVKDVYQSLSKIQKSMDLVKATNNIVAHKKKNEAVLKEIEDDRSQLPVDGQLSDELMPMDSHQLALARIKALEYEVALLKSKLYRAE
ncbi:MAG: hypothetical protein ACAH59_14005, partial [Pseudobdellovibrionaceae bacterium]